MAHEPHWVDFDSPLEVLQWGRSSFTIIRLPPELQAAARGAGTRRVEGSIEDVPVNVGVNRADVLPEAFVYVGKPMQRRLGVRPGELVSCRLRPADPDEVPLPDDVREALAGAGRLPAFERKKPADRRRLLQPIEAAARPETRGQRIATLLTSLAAG